METHIKDIFGESRVLRPSYRSRRDELVDFFFFKVKPDFDAMGKKPLVSTFISFRLNHLRTRDLEYLRSVCLDAERRGRSFAKTFWYEIKPKHS